MLHFNVLFLVLLKVDLIIITGEELVITVKHSHSKNNNNTNSIQLLNKDMAWRDLLSKADGQTDRCSGRQTDEQTDGQTYRFRTAKIELN